MEGKESLSFRGKKEGEETEKGKGTIRSRGRFENNAKRGSTRLSERENEEQGTKAFSDVRANTARGEQK